MPAVPRPSAPAVFEFKSAALTLIAVSLKTADLALLADGLRERLAETPGLFGNDPVVVDIAPPLRDADEAIDFPALAALLREHGMVPVAVRGGSAAQTASAREAGYAEAAEGLAPARAQPPVEAEADAPTATAAEPPAVAPPPGQPPAVATQVVDRPLRSGQQVYARNADLVVLAAVSFGAEVIADGHIHVYAPLRGRAIAGARGNADARIFTTCMEPQLISIAGTYRTTDTELPAEVLGKPAQARLEGDRLVIEPLAG